VSPDEVHPVFVKIFWCRGTQPNLNLFSPVLASSPAPQLVGDICTIGMFPVKYSGFNEVSLSNKPYFSLDVENLSGKPLSTSP